MVGHSRNRLLDPCCCFFGLFRSVMVEGLVMLALCYCGVIRMWWGFLGSSEVEEARMRSWD
jgi:hypothetical protein